MEREVIMRSIIALLFLMSSNLAIADDWELPDIQDNSPRIGVYSGSSYTPSYSHNTYRPVNTGISYQQGSYAGPGNRYGTYSGQTIRPGGGNFSYSSGTVLETGSD